MSHAHTDPAAIHIQMLSGVDEHVNPPAALCGAKTGALARLGDRAAATCTACKALERLICGSTTKGFAR